VVLVHERALPHFGLDNCLIDAADTAVSVESQPLFFEATLRGTLKGLFDLETVLI
jgi:hypothetical protein